MVVGGQRHAPAAWPPGKTQHQMYIKLNGPQGRSGRVRKTLSPLGFKPRTVQLKDSRYTDCATPSHLDYKHCLTACHRT
jgi:hypothetical protein